MRGSLTSDVRRLGDGWLYEWDEGGGRGGGMAVIVRVSPRSSPVLFSPPLCLSHVNVAQIWPQRHCVEKKIKIRKEATHSRSLMSSPPPHSLPPVYIGCPPPTDFTMAQFTTHEAGGSGFMCRARLIQDSSSCCDISNSLMSPKCSNT